MVSEQAQITPARRKMEFSNRGEYHQLYTNLVRMEREEEMTIFREEVAKISGAQRERMGKTLQFMRGIPDGNYLARPVVKFEKMRGRPELPQNEFSPGDLVVISHGDPLVANLPTGTVVGSGPTFIRLQVEDDTGAYFHKGPWRIDKASNTVTYDRMERSLKDMLVGPETDVVRCLLGQGDDTFTDPDYEPLNEPTFLNEGLNESQQKAVRNALHHPMTLIQGPPGTGKTVTAVEIIRQYLKQDKRVLACADSNIGVDNLMEGLLNAGVRAVRIGHPTRVTDRILAHTIGNLVNNSREMLEAKDLRDDIRGKEYYLTRVAPPTSSERKGLTDDEILSMAAMAAEKGKDFDGFDGAKLTYWAEWIRTNRELDELAVRVEELEEEAIRNTFDNIEVICSTNAGAGSAELRRHRWDAVVLDECTQSTEPSCMIPVSRAKQVVLIGDHKQLPPTVICQEAKQLTISLFERMVETYEHYTMLDTQFRMHEKIAHFSNTSFYDSRIVTHESNRERSILHDLDGNPRAPELDPGRPLVFRQVRGKEERDSGSFSYRNRDEARVIASMVDKLIQAGVPAYSIGVVSTYAKQVELLRGMLRRFQGLEVKTVDGYQGREKEVIILSLVRSNRQGKIGFLEDYRRLNVAITRARSKCIIVGDIQTVTTDGLYRSLVNYIRELGAVIGEPQRRGRQRDREGGDTRERTQRGEGSRRRERTRKGPRPKSNINRRRAISRGNATLHLFDNHDVSENPDSFSYPASMEIWHPRKISSMEEYQEIRSARVAKREAAQVERNEQSGKGSGKDRRDSGRRKKDQDRGAEEEVEEEEANEEAKDEPETPDPGSSITETFLTAANKDELKAACRERGEKVGGTKADLIARLRNHL